VISIKKQIELHCAEYGITIPGGFGRNTPSRYAIIRRDTGIPKLVAKTWFKHEDIAYYVQNTLIPELGSDFHLAVDILDFKDGHRLRYNGSNRLLVENRFGRHEDANARNQEG
jgi:hypothetical protein